MVSSHPHLVPSGSVPPRRNDDVALTNVEHLLELDYQIPVVLGHLTANSDKQ